MISLGPLPPNVEITTWPNRMQATGGTVARVTWDVLRRMYQADGRRVLAKDKLRAPAFAVVRDQCTAETCDHAGRDGKPAVLPVHRCDRAVVRVTALAVEHDHHDGDTPVPIDHAIDTLRRLGLAALVYETPSSTPQGPRWRIIVPITEPWSEGLPGAWKVAYRAVQAELARELGCAIDETTANPSRVFYPPTRPTEATPPRRVEWVDGRALDMAGTLATIPAPAPSPAPIPAPDHRLVSAYGSADIERRAIALLAACDPAIQGQRGSTATTLTAAKLVRGLEIDDEAALRLMIGHYNPRCVPPWSEREMRRRVSEAHKIEAIPIGGLLRDPHPLLTKLTDEARAGDDARLFDCACKLWRKVREGQLDGAVVGAELDAVCAGRPDSDRARRTVANARRAIEGGSAPHRLDGEPDGGPPERLEGPDAADPPDTDTSRGRGVRLADALPPGTNVDPSLVVPHGFAVSGGVDRVTTKPAKEPGGSPEVTRTTFARVPIWIGAELVRPEGNLWRLDGLVRGRVTHAVVESGLLQDPRKLAQITHGSGLRIAATKSAPFELAAYLDHFYDGNTIPRRIARPQMGWDEALGTFLLGSEPIGPTPLALHNPAAEVLASHLRAAGSASAWRDVAEEILRHSPAAGLVLAASVASPMLRPLGWAPIGIALGALGGGNKSTLLRLAASAWGSHGDASSRQANGLVGNGNATLLALLGQVSALADLPHLVDELRATVTDPRSRTELEGALHQLIDGVERARMKRDGSGPRSIAVAPGCAVFATETDVSEFLTRGGAVRRYLPLPGPYATRPLGGYVAALAANHGHAGRALVAALVKTPRDARAALAARRDSHLGHLRDGADPRSEAIRTWSDQIAVALAATDVACQLCPDAFPDPELWQSQILACWDGLRALACASDDGADSADVTARAYRETVAWIGSMRAHLHPSPQRARARPEGYAVSAPVRDPVIGRVFAAEDEGRADEALQYVDVLATALRDYLAGRGYSIGTMAASWADRGWIARPAGRGNRNLTWNARLGGVQVEVYRVALTAGEPRGGE